ncbi:Eukaryotic translation initiation factor 4E-binding protein 2 [Galemys pyrenaicus]|uniref:Eukaryotic translation initiation factor 4E-binding protein 2 n=1 Tax=Galemys pyrenaicus TaxID=202257 RepID=A0A8J5ZMK0_GALPY|nr:Eukaryotic translation initiation factor 4E-binding protein 2 [Galemys pyrenaicus]
MSSSAGSGHQPSQSRAIPTRTVPISDAAQLPHDYCTTPGGTLFSTTPGGERCPPRRGPCLRSLQPASERAGPRGVPRIVPLCTRVLGFGVVSRAFLERKLRVIRSWDPTMTCFAAFRTPGGGWNAEFGSLAQRYPALTALFTVLDEAPMGGGESPDWRRE